jgi:adhesin/invasin
MTATTDIALTTLVGTGVSPVPGVVLKDFKGNPVAGVPVTFAVTAGGGTVTGGAAVTNAAGVAIVGSWTLGTKAGSNSLTATAPGVSPVTFTATGNPGPAASLTIAPTEPITIAVGASQQISVSVADKYGNVVERPSFFYSSNNDAIATVSIVGVIKGVSAGNTLITIFGAGLERQVAIVIF